MADSEYRKTQDGDSVVFEVTPATAPKFMAGLIGSGIWILISSSLLLFNLPLLWESKVGLVIVIVLVMFGVLLMYFARQDGRPDGHKSISTFRVSPTKIESNSRTFNKDAIHRLIIKNGITKNVLQLPLTVFGDYPTAAAIGFAHREKVVAIAHSLEVEAGGKAYILAGGMDEVTAYGLMRDVGRIIAV